MNQDSQEQLLGGKIMWVWEADKHGMAELQTLSIDSIHFISHYTEISLKIDIANCCKEEKHWPHFYCD